MVFGVLKFARFKSSTGLKSKAERRPLALRRLHDSCNPHKVWQCHPLEETRAGGKNGGNPRPGRSGVVYFLWYSLHTERPA